MPCVELARDDIRRIHVYTDSRCFLFKKPSGKQTQQLRRCPISSMLWNDIDPFQLSLTVIAPREVACNKASKRTTLPCNKNDARHQCLPGMQFAVHVSRDALYPVLFSSPHRRSNTGLS